MNNLPAFFAANPWVLALIALWTIPWKGVALWKAARNEHTGWFVAILILNTLGILEIIYIFFFSRKRGAMANVPSSAPMNMPTNIPATPPAEAPVEKPMEMKNPEESANIEGIAAPTEKIDEPPISR
ncbi:MAG: DUF5652 family protein [Candidatus Moranbacteria bacterium]|nr:DUF5652 family protein [Candidatus Moranbacteria bacterium]